MLVELSPILIAHMQHCCRRKLLAHAQNKLLMIRASSGKFASPGNSCYPSPSDKLPCAVPAAHPPTLKPRVRVCGRMAWLEVLGGLEGLLLLCPSELYCGRGPVGLCPHRIMASKLSSSALRRRVPAGLLPSQALESPALAPTIGRVLTLAGSHL